jgi:hypothetical protein
MQEFAVHYEDATANWRSITASNHLEAAKDFALQSPRSVDCSIVVKTRNKSPEERWVYDRVGAAYSRRAEVVSAPGHKAGSTAAGAGPSNPYSELRVMRLPVWRSAILMFIITELLLIVVAVFWALVLLGLYWGTSGLGERQSFVASFVLVGVFSETIGDLIAPFALLIFSPLFLLAWAFVIFLVNCALKLTGGLPIWVRR